MNVNFKHSIPTSVNRVFDAIVTGSQMSNYFISQADGDMNEGKTVKWQFSDVGATIDIDVKKIEVNKCIQFSWSVTGKPTIVKITLDKIDDNNTAIQITESDWKNNEEGISTAMQQTIGWTDFYDCLKAYLLFNINLRTGKKLDDLTKTRKDSAVRFLEMAMVDKKPAAAVEYFLADGFKNHNPMVADGKKALSDSLINVISTFPDGTWQTKRVIAENDLVVVHGHRKLNPKEKGFAIMNIFRFNGEKICEQWNVGQQIPDSSLNDNSMF